MKYEPFPYQRHAEEHLMENTAAGLFLDMGLGKTVVTLTALNRFLFETLTSDKILVITTKLVAEDVWTSEAEKWDHLKHLRFSVVLGNEKKRNEALRKEADIYTINVENVEWLTGKYGLNHPFDTWVFDEVSLFKNPDSKRFKSVRQIRPKIKRVIILTGSPAPNSLLDLWAPMFLLDRGERLGESFAKYREQYFHKENAYSPHSKYVIHTEADTQIGQGYYEKKIYNKISDICISMKKEDYLDLPPRIDRNINVKLHGDDLKRYLDFEKEAILEIIGDAEDAEGVEINAINAAALNTKLTQFAGGAVYDKEKNAHEIHKAKIDQLAEILETANGKPVMVAYWFQHELERIQAHLKRFNPVKYKGQADKIAWNNGEISLLCLHPRSGGHGLNLQAGGHIVVWFSMPNWSLELYDQVNARVDRQGQSESVIVHHLLTEGTIDWDMKEAIERKSVGQHALTSAIKARVKKYFENLK